MLSSAAAAACESRRFSMICLMATANRTLVCFSPASRNPRSANTFPELRVTTVSCFPCAITNLVVFPGCAKPPRNQLYVDLGRLSALRRFFLKRMQNVNCPFKLHRVHRAISVRSIVLDNFEDTGTETLPWFRSRVLASELRHAQRYADFVLHRFRKIQEIRFRRPTQNNGFSPGLVFSLAIFIIPFLGSNI